MVIWFKKYWLEVIVAMSIAGVLFGDLSPQFTWMGTDSDGAHYTMAAKYLTTAHHMSAPLYLLLGRLFLFLPLNTEAWRMGLMSVLGTMGSSVFIYLILKHLLRDNPKARWYALISVLVFGGSALVISQSTIIEAYALATMCCVGAYYFVLKQRWILTSVMLGAGLAIQPFFAFVAWAVLFVAFRELRNWKRYGITILFFLFYAYIPIVKILGNDLGMWGNTTTGGFLGGTAGMVLMHTGAISIWDFPKRAIDTILILLASFGLGAIPLIWHFIKTRKWKYHLLWLVLVPIIYFVTDLSSETYVYCLPAIAFGSIAIGLGLSKMNIRWAWATCAVAVGLLGFNANYFDIGRTLDPEMSAMKFYHDLDRIPDGQYFLGGGWTWSMVYVYNKEEGRNIIPISTDNLLSEEYLVTLDDMEIKYAYPVEYFDPKASYITKQGLIAVSIAKKNENVWIAKETKPEVYQYEIVPATGQEAYIGRWIGQEVQPEWKWKPSNPWEFISGQLEVREWTRILQSNKNMLLVMTLGLGGYYLSLFLLWMVKRNQKKTIKRTGNG